MLDALAAGEISLGTAKFVTIEAYEAEGGRVTRDLFSDEVFLASPALLDRLFIKKLDAALADLVEMQGWAWAEAWLNYYELDQMKLARLYPIEGELTEAEAEEYDELADLANGGFLDEDGEARLSELQVLLDGDFSGDQKAHAGCIILVNGSGKIEITAGLVRPGDKREAIEAGVLQAPQATKSDTPKSPTRRSWWRICRRSDCPAAGPALSAREHRLGGAVVSIH